MDLLVCYYHRERVASLISRRGTRPIKLIGSIGTDARHGRLTTTPRTLLNLSCETIENHP
jgi:hypothetical protein